MDSAPPKASLRAPLPLVLDRLEQRLIAQGGRTFTEPCRGRELAPVLNQDQTRVVVEAAWTNGCGGQTRCATKYEAVNQKGEELGEREAVACAVDDAVYLWPRYQTDE